MMNRRHFVAGTFALPLLRPTAAFALTEDPVYAEALDVADLELLALSPDGTLILGRSDDHALVILQSDGVKEIARSSSAPEIKMLTSDAPFSWSPDNAYLAFAIDSGRLMRDADIFVLDTATGDLRRMTGENRYNESDDIQPGDQIDAWPVWQDTETLLFARSPYTDNGMGALTLNRLTIADVTVEQVAGLAAGPAWILSPMYLQPDGSIVSTLQALGRTSIVRIHPEGKVEDLPTPDLEVPLILAGNGTTGDILLVDVTTPGNHWYMNVVTGEQASLLSMLDREDAADAGGAIPVFGPNSGEIATISASGDAIRVTKPGGGSRTIGQLPKDVQLTKMVRLGWGGSKLFIADDSRAWMLDIPS